MAWSTKYGWAKRSVAFDPLFDITSYLSDDTLRDLSIFINGRRSVVPVWEASTDQMLILARLAHKAALEGRSSEYSELRQEYGAEADLAFPAVQAVEINKRRLSNQVTSEELSISTAAAEEALRDFSLFAVDLSLEWFVISGTFLGVVRENGFLEHDYDMDLGCFCDEAVFLDIVSRLRVNRVFTIRQVDYQIRFVTTENGDVLQRLPACLKVTHKNGIPIDLFVHYREGGVCWHGSAVNRWDNADFTLAKYELAGLTVSGPADADRYLTENYGNWRVPVRNFVSTDGSGTPNLKLVRNLFTVPVFLKRMVSAEPKHRARLVYEMEQEGAVTRVGNQARLSPGFGRLTH